ASGPGPRRQAGVGRANLNRPRGRKQQMKRSTILRLLVVPLVLGSVALGLALATGGSAPRASSATPSSSPPGAAISRTGEASLTQVEQYWQNRLTYPTGRFDQRWVLHAARQAARIKSGRPSGHLRARAGLRSVRALGAARSLGPQPQESTGC